MGYSTLYSWVIICILLAPSVDMSYGYSSFDLQVNRTSTNPERRLVQHLLSTSPEHSQKFRPRPKGNPVIVNFDLTIVQILDFDQKQQKLTTQTWQNMQWYDEDLTWDPEEFDGITTLRIDSSLIWIPDITLYNTYGEPKVLTDQFKVLLSHTGHILHFPLVIQESSCQVDLHHFPFDTQKCILTFGSWSYSIIELDITTNASAEHILNQYIHSIEWDLRSIEVTKEPTIFPCCADAYVVVTYTLYLRRNAGYHVRVILLPVMLLSIMAVFIFCIPAHRPDRTGLGLGLFTSFMLLLLLVVDISPPSAESNLSTYLSACVGIVTSALVVSIVHIHVTTWKSDIPIRLTKIVRAAQRILFPLTFVDVDQSCGGAAKMADWTTVVVFLDRIMFVVFSIILIICLSLYFPFPS